MRILTQFENHSRFFQDPESIISCLDLASVPACFQKIERALAGGYYLAGFFSYEAGYCFEKRLRDQKPRDFPLVCFGVYSAPSDRGLSVPTRKCPGLRNLRLNITPDRYARHIRIIRDAISRGDVYQVTYCLKLLFEYAGDPFSLYSSLLREQPVPYPAYVETDRFHILSLSPEMFIKKKGPHVVTKPMKGTWPRGGNPWADFWERQRFQHDEKNRAENVMIADLLRNDLGRIGREVRAPKLFEVSSYRTLFQMTSTVTARVEKDIALYELFAALFPSGSVTGAPKISAMNMIRELEGEDRKIYTGAIGYITPDRDLFFNIPIRTILLSSGAGEMGIGGGIVWDSTPAGEWEEGLLKARFVTGRSVKETRLRPALAE